MQTELAQIISLTSYGNEFVKSGQISNDYFPNATLFQHCNKVDFHDFKKSFFFSRQTEKISADNPLEWFKLLKKEGCVKFQLYYKSAEESKFGPEYNLAGFVGGAGTWLIETNFGSYSHYWQKRWRATNKNAEDKKIWEVNYARVVDKMQSSNQQGDVDKLKAQFGETLKQLIAFCTKQGLKYWLETFEKANGILSDQMPNKLFYHHDLIVIKNYSLTAQQLLFSAGTSWVFGGMGWWNDMYFEDNRIQEEYLQLSQKLYGQILQSIIATINSSTHTDL